MYVNGQFIESSSGEVISVFNPSTEEHISNVPSSTVEDVKQAINAAEKAQKEWKKVPASERAKYLTALAAELRNNKEHLARVISEEQGKVMALSRTEIDFTADYIDYMAGMARSYEGEILQSDRPGENIMIFKEPVGVIAGFLPWNFPFFLVARKAAPALVTGNTIVIKPSSETPNNALEFAKLADKVGIPKGVFNVITGKGSVVGDELAASEKIDLVSLTGSVPAGVSVMKAAANNVTKVSLELGGKAPALVMEDADIDLAVKAIVESRVINSGQVCNCAERVYVHENIAGIFTAKIVEAMKNVKYGNPLEEEDLDMGPLVSKNALDSVHGLVERAVEEGAKILTGGKIADKETGYYYEPTVLVNVKQDSEIVREEVFGPVLPIMTFKDFDEAIELANDCQYGLTSSIYTQNIDYAMRAANELLFGETYINRENFEAIQGFHSGRKKSGIGGADGRHGLEEFLQTHVVYLQHNANKK
jgi:lactaldehyde dehydrogenase / glycolaldehyde dehydrogenase